MGCFNANNKLITLDGAASVTVWSTSVTCDRK